MSMFSSDFRKREYSTGVAETITRNPPSELYVQVGRNIAQFRKEIRMTQAELAAKTGITQALTAQFEAGIRRIPLQTLVTFAKILHVELEDLVPRETPSKKPGPKPRIQEGYERIRQLPEKKQAMVLDFIDTLSETASS